MIKSEQNLKNKIHEEISYFELIKVFIFLTCNPYENLILQLDLIF